MNFFKIINKLLIPIMIIAILVAFNEQNKTEKNVYIIIASMAVFIFGMIQLSAKTPSKNQENQDEND